MLSEKIIPPKGEGEIKVTYSSGKRKGNQSKSIQVLSNDPEQPKLPLKVKGIVKEAVVCSPSALNFGKVLQGETTTKKISVTPGEGEKMKVTNVEVTSEYLTADFSKIKEDDKEGYVVNVTLSPDAPRGSVQGQVGIHTDNEHAKQITVRVNATITGEVVANPDQISLFIKKGEQNTPSAITVEKLKGSGLVVSKVETDLEFISTELQQVEEGKRYKVQVNGSPQAPIGTTHGKITIHTNDKDDPNINVSLIVTVKGNLTLTPKQLSFGLVTQGEPSTRTITLTTLKEDLKVKKVECSIDFLTTKVDEQQSGKRFQIGVSVDKDAPTGAMKGTVIIHTNDPLEPKLEVPISGTVRVKKPST